MKPGRDFMREMRRGEEAAVEELLRAAFGSEDEARLVRALRKSGDLAGESVVAQDGRIVGYFALSWLVKPKGWLALAPVAVDPGHQGQGIGRRMCGMLSEWARLSRQMVLVLGEPGFYERAGFSQARAARLNAPYPVAHLLLAGPGDDAPEATLVYPRAFDGL